MLNKIEELKTKEAILSFLGRDTTLACTIELTRGCNLRCSHCAPAAGHKLDNELTLEEIKQLINHLRKLGVITLIFTGGEPLLRKDLVDILQYAHSKGMQSSIETNGIALTRNFIKNLEKLGVTLVRVSLDGDAVTHDTVRNFKGAWKITSKNLKELRKYFKKKITIGAVMLPDNWDNLDDILVQSVNLGADIFSLLFLVDIGRAKSKEKISTQQYKEGLAKLFGTYSNLKTKIEFSSNIAFPPALLPRNFNNKGISTTYESCNLHNHIKIGASGDVFPCDGLSSFFDMKVGNIRTTALEDILSSSKKLKKIRSFTAKDLTGVCKKCNYKNTCKGGCRAFAYGKYNEFNAPNPICQMLYEQKLFPKRCLVK